MKKHKFEIFSSCSTIFRCWNFRFPLRSLRNWSKSLVTNSLRIMKDLKGNLKFQHLKNCWAWRKNLKNCVLSLIFFFNHIYFRSSCGRKEQKWFVHVLWWVVHVALHILTKCAGILLSRPHVSCGTDLVLHIRDSVRSSQNKE